MTDGCATRVFAPKKTGDVQHHPRKTQRGRVSHTHTAVSNHPRKVQGTSAGREAAWVHSAGHTWCRNTFWCSLQGCAAVLGGWTRFHRGGGMPKNSLFYSPQINVPTINWHQMKQKGWVGFVWVCLGGRVGPRVGWGRLLQGIERVISVRLITLDSRLGLGLV